MAETGKTTQGLASVGIEVTVGGAKLNYVSGIGEIGGEPNLLDATSFADTFAKNVPGVKKNDGFAIDFFFDNTSEESDYRKLAKLKGIQPIVIAFPDGTSFSTTGYVSVKTNAVKVNELISATATCALQSDWTVKNPAGE